jgi:signal transduction histidine kinase
MELTDATADAAAARRTVRSTDRLAALQHFEIVGPSGTTEPGTPLLPDDSLQSLRRLAHLAAAVCETQSSVVNILDATYQHTVASYGVDPSVCAVDDSMCAVVLADAATVMVPDAAHDDRFRANPFVTGRLGHLRLYASTPLLAPGGQPLGTLCVFDDEPARLGDRQLANLEMLAAQVVEVLELRRRTLRLARAHEELARSNTLLSEFAGRISHDLKSPLTSVIGFAETAAALPGVADDPRLSRFVGNISSAGMRMRTLIDDLLDFASTGGHPQLARVDMSAVMDDVLRDLDRLLSEAGAEVTVEDGCVDADRTQLRMLLQNLVANAVTYRRPGRPCRIRVRADAAACGWTVQVADNGPGIPVENRKDVLDPLFRLQRDASVQGTGLGLATCRRVAEAHGGTLTVGETPGGGATVTLYVPSPG